MKNGFGKRGNFSDFAASKLSAWFKSNDRASKLAVLSYGVVLSFSTLSSFKFGFKQGFFNDIREEDKVKRNTSKNKERDFLSKFNDFERRFSTFDFGVTDTLIEATVYHDFKLAQQREEEKAKNLNSKGRHPKI